MTTVGLINFNHATQGRDVTWADMGVSDDRPNYGDMLVCASLLQHLDPGVRTVRTKFGKTVPDDIDLALLRGSTYLNRVFDYDGAIKTLESIKVPVATIGLGVQFRRQEVAILDKTPGAKRFIEMLDERSVSISVRGEFTADVVTRLGARNVRITGCPSLFYSGRIPSVRLPMLLGSHHRRLGLSMHTGLRNSMFCSDEDRTRDIHIKAMRYAMDHASKASFFEQGVKMEFDLADPRLSEPARRAAADAVIERLDGVGRLTVEELIARTVSVRSIDEWLSKARDLDAMIGFRFHGNMIALLQSLPCYYWTYDSRLKEFCDLYKLPYSDVAEEWVDPVDAMMTHDWDAANRAFEACYTELRNCYEENGLPHVLPPVAHHKTTPPSR